MDKKRIYVADDDPNILELMSIILEMQGYEVITSPDGRSLKTISHTPDVVFLDIGMSGTDGSEICRDFKNNPLTASRPVILVSANTNIREIAKSCGADDILPKPFDIKTVMDLASRYTSS